MSDSQNSGSARKSLVELFRNSEKMPMAVVESAPQAILSIDRTGRIVFANRRSEEIFGYRHEELLGAPVEMLLPQFERRGQAHANTPGGKERFELTARRHDGQEFPAEVSLSHIETEEGDFSIAFVGDIGHRRRLEEQSLQGQKMDATGRLAGCVAHDFNNMLTVIAGYNRMMLDELSPNDPLRSYAEEILRAADRASAITHQLLTFSRRQLARPRVIRLNEVVTQAEQMLRHLSGEKVRLQLRLAADTGSIQADPVHVEQAIVNLAQNGRDAMPQGGELIIETDNVHLDDDSLHTNLGMSQPGEFVMLSVTDTGHGMDAETRGRIFEPFFTTKEKGRGAGLGLATVYGIVRQAGGDIWVYTEPGRGSTFKLYFPLVAGSTESHEPRNAPARVVDPAQTILLVEDEKAVRELTLTMLRQLGYSVLAAESGGHALRISEGHGGEIALLVTDVVMPGMSGRQLADALMIVRPGMRVLFLSGYTENTVVHHGVLGAGVDFLPKPFSREVLGKKLREILSR